MKAAHWRAEAVSPCLRESVTYAAATYSPLRRSCRQTHLSADAQYQKHESLCLIWYEKTRNLFAWVCILIILFRGSWPVFFRADWDYQPHSVFTVHGDECPVRSFRL